MASPVVEKIIHSCEMLGGFELGGIKLEDAEPALLNVSEFDLDTHVAMQPAAIAYYGSLKRQALRRLTSQQRQYERWEKKRYADAKASLGAGTGKSTLADIDARYVIDNDAGIEKWETDIEKAQLEFDTLDVWFEAWRQKGFSIREYAGIEEAERFNSNPSISGKKSQEQKSSPQPEVGIQRIRRIIHERKLAEGERKG